MEPVVIQRKYTRTLYKAGRPYLFDTLTWNEETPLPPYEAPRLVKLEYRIDGVPVSKDEFEQQFKDLESRQDKERWYPHGTCPPPADAPRLTVKAYSDGAPEDGLRADWTCPKCGQEHIATPFQYDTEIPDVCTKCDCLVVLFESKPK